MVAMLQHRGPDESGIYLDDWTGLGNARLNIIDLVSGTQPISDESERRWIVYNGEIFNYPELAAELSARGHTFRTRTDTEVILHLYEEEGPACLSRLNGQFAFAIWDRERRELFLARDRVGIRPLFYTITGDSLVFASEIKSLFAAPGIQRRIDPVALRQVFTYWSPLPGRTFFQGVAELPPGHCLVASPGRLEVRRWWEIPFAPPEEQTTASEETLREEVSALVEDAVRIRLRADVPVGCYLSGGLDSSGLAARVSRHHNRDVRTFGIRFEEPDFDEGVHQQCMVEALGVHHAEVHAGNVDIAAALPEVVWHCEVPLLRTAPAPLFLLSRAVHEDGYKVVLAGEGGDEVFAGYNIFREAEIRRRWAAEPDPARRERELDRLYPYLFGEMRSRRVLTAFFSQGLDRLDDPFFSHLLRWKNTSRIRAFLAPGLREPVDGDGLSEFADALPAGFSRWEPLARAQYLESRLFLPNYLLSSQGDRVAMAHAVEVRLPYLDHRLLEYMGRVPAQWKMRDMEEKYLLKRVFEGEIPDSVLRRPKQPYRAPIKSSLLGPGLPDHARALLEPAAIEEAGLFDAPKVQALLKKLKAKSAVGETENMALVGILSAQLLHDQFIRRYPHHAPAAVDFARVIDRRTESSHRA